MPRIMGVDIPGKKRLEISLRYLYGIGPALSRSICQRLGLDPNMRADGLSEADIGRVSAYLQATYVVEGDLRRRVANDIKRLVGIQCYRGLRHRLGLPVNGQRTRTNARTRKGKRKTVAGKKKAPTAK
jgi:small subunit ribosomal protein S13